MNSLDKHPREYRTDVPLHAAESFLLMWPVFIQVELANYPALI